MAQLAIPRLIIGAPKSGSGKTTVVCALLQLLRQRGMKTTAFKNGPDYIDPMFHAQVLGVPSYNLDLFLFGGEAGGIRTARQLIARHTGNTALAVIEGAMGYYDGIAATSEASTYALAGAVSAPAVLVVDGKGAALSLAAQIKGLAEFRTDSHITGFIVNNVSRSVYDYFKDIWKRETGLIPLGYIPVMEDCRLSSRHLGLITADEIKNLRQIMNKLAAQAEQSIDVEGILRLARSAPELSYDPVVIPSGTPVRIAVAKDKAFCFYYEDALDLLTQMGAEIIPFSPLTDARLPLCDGIYLGGGYPELYVQELQQNTSMRENIRKAIQQGMPCLGECGGFMYLLEQFRQDQQTRNWAGAIKGTCAMTSGLIRFGYVTLVARQNTLLCRAGESIRAHEFHYSDSTHNGSAFTAHKALGKRSWPCIYAQGNLLAGYPHIHLWGNPKWAWNFLEACRQYKTGVRQCKSRRTP